MDPSYQTSPKTTKPSQRRGTGPETSLIGRYGDGTQILEIAPSINHEIAVRVGNEVAWVDALDLLRVVSHVALSLVYEPSPTEADCQAVTR